MEVDYMCLSGDYSSMCVIIERLRPTGVPSDLWVANRGGLRSVLHTSHREE